MRFFLILSIVMACGMAYGQTEVPKSDVVDTSKTAPTATVSPDPKPTDTATPAGKEAKAKSTPKPKKGYKSMTANIETSMGTIKVKLFPSGAPLAVDNFVGLAEGTKEYKDPKTGDKKKSHFYDGLIFHRVIPGFMIQGGDPLGSGMGGPGYTFKNEEWGRLFDTPGLLAMANAGKDTNGSQFFITTDPQSHLNGGYTIFGEVTEGLDVVKKISEVKRDNNDRPLTPVTIKKVTIIKK